MKKTLFIIAIVLSSCTNVFKSKLSELKNVNEINIENLEEMQIVINFCGYFGEVFYLTYDEAKKDYVVYETTSDYKTCSYLSFDDMYINELFSLAKNFLNNYFFITKNKFDVLFSSALAEIKSYGFGSFRFMAQFYYDDFTGSANFIFNDNGYLMLTGANIVFPSDEIVQIKDIVFECIYPKIG